MSCSRFLSAMVPVALTVVVAGCGSSSTNTTASHKHAMHHMSGHSMTHMASHEMMMAARNAGLTIKSSRYGKVLYGPHHLVVYVFSADHGSTSTCHGVCASAWPPLLTTGAPRVGSGLNSKLLGTTRRSNGSMQVTYGGHPLYYWSGDKPATISCQHVNLHGGFWYVVKANGTPNMAKGVDTMSSMS